MKKAFLYSAILLAGVFLFCGLLAEGTIRAYASVNRAFGAGLKEFDPMAVQIEPHGRLGYRQRPNSVLHYGNGAVATANSMNYRGPEVPLHPAPGTIRIILLGGSTTHGFGVADDQTIDTYMRQQLTAKYPGVRFDVVNLALDGYDALQMLERLRTDGLPMSPSIVVLNEGINDVRNAQFPNLTDSDPRTLIWEAVLARLRDEQRHGPSLWTLMKHYSYTARTPGYIREQLRRRQEEASRRGIAPVQAGRAAPDARHGPPYPEAAEYFERNMREMVRLSLADGAAVLLSTPPSALPTYAPTATSNRSYWIIDAKTTQTYRDTLARRLRLIDSTEEAQHHAVRYVAPTVEANQFLDDCHLTPDGNRAVAAAFVAAIEPFVAAKLPMKTAAAR
jgi:lysophospholipase L1-like esterase